MPKTLCQGQIKLNDRTQMSLERESVVLKTAQQPVLLHLIPEVLPHGKGSISFRTVPHVVSISLLRTTVC